jgi:hypothetical protein
MKFKTVYHYILFMILAIVISNAGVELLDTGTLGSIAEHPVRFVVSTLVLGILGGILLHRFAKPK